MRSRNIASPPPIGPPTCGYIRPQVQFFFLNRSSFFPLSYFSPIFLSSFSSSLPYFPFLPLPSSLSPPPFLFAHLSFFSFIPSLFSSSFLPFSIYILFFCLRQSYLPLITFSFRFPFFLFFFLFSFSFLFCYFLLFLLFRGRYDLFRSEQIERPETHLSLSLIRGYIMEWSSLGFSLSSPSVLPVLHSESFDLNPLSFSKSARLARLLRQNQKAV